MSDTRSPSRFGRLQRATAVVPLALLSAAWTASLTTSSSTTNAAAGIEPDGTLPDGSSVPAQAIEAPASVSAPDKIAGSVGGGYGNAEQVVATSSVNGIPSSALAAYQRAETVINAADKTCNLSWQLIAAIGRVESNHGRFGGNVLDADGVASPGIRGIALDGTNGTALIRDTDAGQYDDDVTFDRAVGPMQFIPSTWAVVGVDADNDGTRNPQDIDDAALATGVYLCSGDDDLATLPGQRTSVFRYNNSESYVSLVLSIMDNYLQGDYTSVPDSTTAAGYLTPVPSAPSPNRGGRGPRGNGGGSNDGGGGTVAPAPTTEPEPEPSSEPEPTDEPTKPPQDNPVPNIPGGPNPPSVNVPPEPDVPEVLTVAEATVQCTLDGRVNDPLRDDDAFDKCVEEYTSK